MVVAMLPNGSCCTVDRVDEDGTWWLDGDGAQFGEHDDYRSEPLAWPRWKIGTSNSSGRVLRLAKLRGMPDAG